MTWATRRTQKGFSETRTIGCENCPEGLLHNIISHGVAKLAEFLDDDLTDIVAMAGQSPLLKSVDDEQILDELRVLLRDQRYNSIFLFFDPTQGTQPVASLRYSRLNRCRSDQRKRYSGQVPSLQELSDVFRATASGCPRAP